MNESSGGGRREEVIGWSEVGTSWMGRDRTRQNGREGERAIEMHQNGKETKGEHHNGRKLRLRPAASRQQSTFSLLTHHLPTKQIHTHEPPLHHKPPHKMSDDGGYGAGDDYEYGGGGFNDDTFVRTSLTSHFSLSLKFRSQPFLIPLCCIKGRRL